MKNISKRHKQTNKQLEETVKHLWGAAQIMNCTGENNSPFTIDDNGP
jgi:hypothetical protein